MILLSTILRPFKYTIWTTLPYGAYQHSYGRPLDITIWLLTAGQDRRLIYA